MKACLEKVIFCRDDCTDTSCCSYARQALHNAESHQGRNINATTIAPGGSKRLAIIIVRLESCQRCLCQPPQPPLSTSLTLFQTTRWSRGLLLRLTVMSNLRHREDWTSNVGVVEPETLRAPSDCSSSSRRRLS